MQLDIGFGDIITPGPTEIEYPTMLDFPAPVIRAYPKETVVAEKLEALTALGLLNSRMKDYYDLALLSRMYPLMANVWQMRSSRPFGIEERQSRPSRLDSRKHTAMILHEFFSGGHSYAGAGSEKSRVTWRASLTKSNPSCCQSYPG